MTYTILLIDDDLSSLKALERTIRRLESDCVIISSLSSSSYLNELQFQIPDLVICDYLMPEYTGDVVLEYIRNTYPMCFRVMLTADVSDSVFFNSIKHANFSMAKPYKADDIKSVLRIVREIKQLKLPVAVESQLVSQLELPTLSPVTKSLMNKLRGSNCDLAEISELISQDVVLSGKVIQTANSVLLGFQSSTNSLSVAVARIGLNLLEMLIITLQIERTFCMNDTELNELNYKYFRMGRIGKAISKIYKMVSVEQDLVVSSLILSGIGVIARRSIFSDLSASLDGLDDNSVERVLCFFILTIWGFDEVFIEKTCGVQLVGNNGVDNIYVVISLASYLANSFSDDEDVFCNMDYIAESMIF